MKRRARLTALVCAAVGLAACSTKIAKPGNGVPAAHSAVAKQVQQAVPSPNDAGPPRVAFKSSDFQESEHSRDPFRSFLDEFAEEAKSTFKNQRKVVLDQYSIDELKVIGIVTRIHPAVAMLVGPDGKGYAVKRGQFVGKPERVQAGQNGASYEINWRVDRIRPADVVLVRENPANPDVPTATKVIPLRPTTAPGEALATP